MLRRSCRWQPHRNIRSAILSMPGSAGCGSTPATATLTTSPPPDDDDLVGAAKIPRRSVCPPIFQHPGPAGWPSTPTTPECKIDVGESMRQRSCKPTSLQAKLAYPGFRSTTGGISFVGEGCRFKDGADQALLPFLLPTFDKVQRIKNTAHVDDHKATLNCSTPGVLFSISTHAALTGRMAHNSSRNFSVFGVSKRYYSTEFHWTEPLPAPASPPKNLLEVMKPCIESDTKLFKVHVEKTEDLVRARDLDKQVLRNALDLSSLKEIYYKKVRPALRIRGMISLHSLDDPEFQLVHNRYKRITGQYPIYMTCLDVMENLAVTEDDKWTPSLDSFSHNHVFVIEDWVNSFHTSSGYTFYDYGLRVGPYGGKGYIRGECDASFNHMTKIAKLSTMFWRDDQVLSCSVFYGIQCADSIEAECTAMYFLLKTGRPYDKLQVSGDCLIVINVLKGLHKVTHWDKNYEMMMLLRYMRRCYSELIPRWENRENLLFVDSLLRGKENREYELAHMTAFLARWASPLRGYPIYIVSGYKHSKITKLAKRHCMLTEFQNTCFCEVEEEEHKMPAVWHIISSLEAQKVRLVVDNFDSRPELKKQYGDLFGTPTKIYEEGPSYSVTVLKVPPSTNTNFERTSVNVVIVFDSALATHYIKEEQDYYLVLLSTPEERCSINNLNIQSFSPMSFVSVHRHTNADNGSSATTSANLGTPDTNSADNGP